MDLEINHDGSAELASHIPIMDIIVIILGYLPLCWFSMQDLLKFVISKDNPHLWMWLKSNPRFALGNCFSDVVQNHANKTALYEIACPDTKIILTMNLLTTILACRNFTVLRKLADKKHNWTWRTGVSCDVFFSLIDSLEDLSKSLEDTKDRVNVMGSMAKLMEQDSVCELYLRIGFGQFEHVLHNRVIQLLVSEKSRRFDLLESELFTRAPQQILVSLMNIIGANCIHVFSIIGVANRENKTEALELCKLFKIQAHSLLKLYPDQTYMVLHAAVYDSCKNKDIIQWMLNENYPVSNFALEKIALLGNVEIFSRALKLLRFHCDEFTLDMIINAMESGSIDLLRFINSDARGPTCIEKAVPTAISHEYYFFLQFCIDETNIDLELSLDTWLEKGEPDMLRFLLTKVPNIVVDARHWGYLPEWARDLLAKKSRKRRFNPLV